MSTIGAEKAEDIIMVIQWPDTNHVFDLEACTGYFIVDASDLARMTAEGMFLFVDNAKAVTGCMGH